MVLYLICNFVENQKKYAIFLIIKIKISNILKLKLKKKIKIKIRSFVIDTYRILKIIFLSKFILKQKLKKN